MERTGVVQSVPCYILDSSKPIWQGELEDCGIIIGTNALEELGFSIVDSDGKVLKCGNATGIADTNVEKTSNLTDTGPVIEESLKMSDSTNHVNDSEDLRTVVLAQELRLGPQQTRVAQVKLNGKEPSAEIGIVTPSESILTSKHCDFMEGYWTGESTFTIPVTNWGTENIVLSSGCTIGQVDLVTLVDKQDPIWDEDKSPTVARVCQSDREKQLEGQLDIGEECTKAQKASLVQLLKQKQGVFALTDNELGHTDVVEHSIQMDDCTPIKASPRRLPYKLRDKLEQELQNLMETGCIEPSSSSFASGLVLVRKKDGGLRVCVDYRGINKRTILDHYPIPRTDDLIDMIGRCRGQIFTTLDLMKGYHQIKMSPESKDKTAFTCHLGLFQYKRMPFGLTNAPATFQRLMNKLFSGAEWNFVFVYLDDILIVSKSFEEHRRHVEKVLQDLEEVGLKLKPKKCAFAQTNIDYLGHTLSPQGVQPNEAKVAAVKEFPRPTSSTEVRRFLGMVNFYRRHVPNLASVARPLTGLTRKDKDTGSLVKFVWDDQCESAFEKVKEMLVSAPLLHPPDLTKPFYLWTDASGKGFGALLEQEGEDKKRYPIAYASRQTNPAEAKYAPTELEVAALVYAVEHFEVYLLGNNFTVYTDHKALVSAFISHMGSQTKGLLARWYLRISRFLPQMRLEYKPGSANTVADSLVENKESTTVLQVTKETPCLKLIQEQQKQDQELSDLIEYLCDKLLPSDGQTARNVVSMSMKGFVIDNGILYYEGGDTPEKRRLVVPKHLQSQVLDEQHDGIFAGHFGYKRMYSRLKPYYYWKGMSSDILKKCESCVDCASVQGQGFKGRPPLVNIPVGGPFECIGMDFVELDQSADGNRYALVLQDYLTKWPEVYAVANRKAETVAACLVDLIWRHGVPSRIIHDRAAEFLSEVIQETAHLMGMTQLPTSGGHPQTNGLVERFNRTLKQMLSKLVNKNGRNWDKMLGGVLFAYRSTPHQSTGMSPFYLLYGRDPKLPSAGTSL